LQPERARRAERAQGTLIGNIEFLCGGGQDCFFFSM
jgi:hypothetical protein